MSKAGFTYDGIDPGESTKGNVILVDKRIPLIPGPRDRVVVAGPRPGVWDFGTELGDRRIELDVVSGDNTDWAGNDTQMRALAALFNPTNEVADDKGSKQLIFDSEPDKYWLAKLIDGPFPEYFPSGGKLRLTLRCADPLAYSTTQYLVQGGSATLSGFSAYRQIPAIPDVGAVHGWNLKKNGGFTTTPGAEWAVLSGTGTVAIVTDASFASGKAARIINTSGDTYYGETISVEAGKVYSFAGQVRGDAGAGLVWIDVNWLDAAGAPTGTSQFTTLQNPAAVTEASVANVTAPGNARTAQVSIGVRSAGIFFASAIRIKQQATAPLAWSSADQQTLGNKGLVVYEAATNLLTNGDIESALSGTVNGFNESFADGLAWTPNLPAPAANIVTLVAGTTYVAGHSEWWGDGATGSQFRWEWATGGAMYRYIRYVDASNWVRLFADGTNFKLQKNIAGTTTDVATAAAALTNATFYWFTWSQNGTAFTCSINNDSAGALGAAIATHTAQTISDAALQTATTAIGCLAVNLRVGGAFPNVCLVVIAAPPGWTANVVAGVPSFCLSKTVKFSGLYSISTFNANVGAHGYWGQELLGAGTHTASARLKTSAVVGGPNGAFFDFPQLGAGFGATDGTTDWTAKSSTVTTLATQGGVNLHVQGSGTAWADLFWYAAQSYDTGNSDPSGQAYVPTGTRAASSVTETLDSGFNIADFGRVIPFRPDHAYNAHSTVDRWVWCDYIDANNYIGVYVNATDGSIRFRKVRAGIASEATDAAAAAFAAGDSIVVGCMPKAAAGLRKLIYKNGVQVGAAPFTSTTPEAKLTLSGTPTRYIGRGPTAGNEMDGTIGVDRGDTSSVTTANITTSVQSPYAQQDEAYESVVYRFDGSAVVENYASGTLHVDVGGTYSTYPVVEMTAGGAYTGNVTITDASGNVFTWNGTLALNDVLKIDTDKFRAYLNGAVSMAGVQNGSKWPLLLPNQRNALTVGGIAAGNIKALKATFRARFI